MKKILITTLLVGMVSSCKDNHTKRIELIEEKQRLTELSSSIEVQKTSHWLDSMHKVVDSEINVLNKTQ